MLRSNDKRTPLIINRRYKLREILGRGGMGVVYRAIDNLSGHTVALKQVTVPAKEARFDYQRDGPDPTYNLAQESAALSTMRHPNIISVFDFGFDRHRQPYFTGELSCTEK